MSHEAWSCLKEASNLLRSLSEEILLIFIVLLLSTMTELGFKIAPPKPELAQQNRST